MSDAIPSSTKEEVFAKCNKPREPKSQNVQLPYTKTLPGAEASECRVDHQQLTVGMQNEIISKALYARQPRMSLAREE